MAPVLTSGLFIPKEQQSFFLVAFEEVLCNSYNIIPIFEEANNENFCEVKFDFLSSNRAKYSLSWCTKRAKKFLLQNLKLTSPKTKEKSKNTSEVIQVIDLVGGELSKKQKLMGTVDLTVPEEVIVLDETLSDLNETLSELEVTLGSVNNVIDLESPTYTSKTMARTSQPDVQFVKVIGSPKLPRKQELCNSPKTNDTSTLVRSKYPLNEMKKVLNNKNDLNIIVNIKNDSVEQVTKTKNRTVALKRKSSQSSQTIALKRKRSQSPRVLGNKTSKMKRKKLVNGANRFNSFTVPTPKGTSTPRPTSDTVLNYYKKLQIAVKNNAGKMNMNRSKRRLSLGSSVQHNPKRNKFIKGKMKRRMTNQPTSLVQNHFKNSAFESNFRRKPVPLAENNVFNPNPLDVDKSGFRPIVIDGSNIAVRHGRGQFSVKGLKICIDYFKRRGHDEVKVFLPLYRREDFSKELLEELMSKCDMVFTPSIHVDGMRKTSYDDRFIVQYAHEFGGVIISTDNYRDLLHENPKWRETIEKRLLMFTWVDDFLMFPIDPLGKNGPNLEQFLRF